MLGPDARTGTEHASVERGEALTRRRLAVVLQLRGDPRVVPSQLPTQREPGALEHIALQLTGGEQAQPRAAKQNVGERPCLLAPRRERQLRQQVGLAGHDGLRQLAALTGHAEYVPRRVAVAPGQPRVGRFRDAFDARQVLGRDGLAERYLVGPAGGVAALALDKAVD